MTAVVSRGGTEVLTTLALNRALLARQLLLERSRMGALETVEHLLGLQAQNPKDPYVALWTRLEGFRPEELAGMVTARRVVRIGLMRSTIHLVSAGDCRTCRPLFRPVMVRSMQGQFGRHLVGVDPQELVAAGRELVESEPCTIGGIGKHLAERWPGRDHLALGNAVRAWVPLVQVPSRCVWGRSGLAVHTTAESGWAPRWTRTPQSILSCCGTSGPSVRRPSTTSSSGAASPACARSSSASARPSARSPARRDGSCSTFPTLPVPTRTSRPRSASSPSTTTCCSPTSTAPASSPTRTAASSRSS